MRIVVALPLGVAIAFFIRGAWRLRRCRRPGIDGGRLVAAACAFAALGAALSDAADVAAHTSFAAHMVQHLLLVSVAAPALLLADPCAVMLWGLPDRARHAVGPLLAPGRHLRRMLAGATRPWLTWPAYVLVLWLWHLPGPYEAALRSGPIHDLEHVLFFVAAILFWWPALTPAPRLTRSLHPGARVAYLVLAALQAAALGLVLSSRPGALYSSYAATAPAWGLTPAEDQAWGGILMWSIGSAIDMAAILYVVGRAIGQISASDEGRAARRSASGP